MGSFNDNHPELRHGEVWLTNGTISDYAHCRFVTKRFGKQAYSNTGVPLRNIADPVLGPPFRPIFVEVWEKELNDKKLQKEEEKK